MRVVIVVVLILGLVGAQSMQREPTIAVMQLKAAITEVQDEASPAIEKEGEIEKEAEAKRDEITEPGNPFARSADIKNPKPPMHYQEIFQVKNGITNPELAQHPKLKRERDHPRYKNQKPSREDEQEEGMGFDSGLILPVLIGLAVVIFLVKICTKRGRCNKRRLRKCMQRVTMETVNNNSNNSIQLQTIEPIDQSIQFHQAEIKRLKNACGNMNIHPYQRQ